MRLRLVYEHDAGPSEVEHPLDLLDRALEDLAHVYGGVDQGRELPHDREAGCRRPGSARLHGGAVFTCGEVELPDGRGGHAPLLRRRVPVLQPAARQALEIARYVREPIGAETPGRPGEGMRGAVQGLRVLALEAVLQSPQHRPHRLDPLPEPGRELGPDFAEGIGRSHGHNSRS